MKTTGEWIAIARRQHGVISWPQLRKCGVSSTGVITLVKAGRLIRLARSIYGLPAAPGGWERDLWIALLRAGSGAIVPRMRVHPPPALADLAGGEMTPLLVRV